MKYLYLSLIVLLASNISSSQEFEAYNHPGKSTRLLDACPYQNGLIIIEEKQDKGTMVSYMDSNGKIEILYFYEKWFHDGEASILFHEQANQSIDIFLIGFRDYDVLGSQSSLNFDGDTTIRSAFELTTYPVQDAILKENIIYGIGQGRLKTIDINGNMLNSQDLLGVDYKIYDKLNDQYIMYLGKKIFEFSNNQITEIAELNNSIIDIKAYQGKHLVLHSNSISQLSADFSIIENIIPFQGNLGYNRNLRVYGDDFYFAIGNNSIWKNSGDSIIQYYQSSDVNTNINDIIISENSFYITGTHQIDFPDCDKIEYHTLVNKQLNEPINEAYDFVNYKISNLTIENLGFENLTNCDSLYNYKVELDIENLQNESIFTTDFYSDNIISKNCQFAKYDVHEIISEIIPGNSTKRISFEFNAPLQESFCFYSTGANFKRDTDPTDNVVFTDIINSNKKVTILPLEIYPNPVVDYIKMNNETILSGDYQIINLLGQISLQGKMRNNEINTERLDNGFYILFLRSENNELFSSKFSKLR